MRIFYFIILLFLLSCNSKHNKDEIVAAMHQYDRLIQKTDADSIAWLYTPDGNLGNMAIGRDSIRKFLLTFKNIRVFAIASTCDSIWIDKDTAGSYGKYDQQGIIHEKDSFHVKGAYTARWEWMDHAWHIKKMETKPL